MVGEFPVLEVGDTTFDVDTEMAVVAVRSGRGQTGREGSPAEGVTIHGMDAQQLIAGRYLLTGPMPGSAAGLSWRAADQWSSQPVLITQVPVSRLEDSELLRARQEIARDVRVLGGLRHDRLARPVDVVFDKGDLWVASEPLPPATMAGELDRRGMVELTEAARWVRDVADGLAAAHRAGVLHRNLHAGVVGIAADGQAVVGGFATTVLTPEGLRSGVPVHVAPEVSRGAPPSPASDIFALGVLLYRAVEGREPSPPGAARDDTVAAPQRSGPLSAELMRMLHPDPAQRPTATAVADQLRQFCAAPRAVEPTVTWPAAPDTSATRAAPGAGGSAVTALTSVPPAGMPTVLSPGSAAPPPYGGPPPWVPPPDPVVPEQRGPGLPLALTDPAAPRRNRLQIRWVIVAAVVTLLALAGGLLVAFWPPRTAGLPSPIGDPRTADPCSLLSMGSVQRFGSLTMYRDTGHPQSCLIRIGIGEGWVNLWAEFSAPADREPSGVAEQHGKFRIFREREAGGFCDRTMVLGDRSRVSVDAAEGGGAVADLCAVADAGTQTALAALSSSTLPRRDIDTPPQGLTGLDTCSLLDRAALQQVPGLDASRRQPGFAGWLCLWGDNPAFVFTPWAQVAVARRLPLSGQPVQIGGRSAQVLPGGANHPGSCEVDLVQRSYIGSSGDPRVELLEISVFLDAQQPTEVACRAARALAEAAAPKLPPVS